MYIYTNEKDMHSRSILMTISLRLNENHILSSHLFHLLSTSISLLLKFLSYDKSLADSGPLP